MKHKITWLFFFIITVASIVFSVIHKDNALYFWSGIGISWLSWSFAFVFSTPFHWFYKIEEAFYLVWLVGVSTYLLYSEMYVIGLIIIFPLFIHYMSWSKKQEEKGLFYMLMQIEETKDEKLLQVFANEVQKRKYSFRYTFWLYSIAKLEKIIKEEKEKEKASQTN